MNNKRFILPYGDQLREFLMQPGITRPDIKNILRRRGVFLSDDDKTNTVPLITKTGISPCELEELVERIKTKEDNPKVHTQSIPWSGGDKPLLESIPPELSIQELIDEPFSNYKVIGAPNFRAVNGNQNHVEMEFTIERYDLTKSWERNTSQFSGKVSLKKGSENVNVSMSLNHTAPETRTVAEKVSRKLVAEMKSAGVVNKTDEIQRIRFNDFANENRIAFLQDLAQKQLSEKLYFRDTRDIGFRPDKRKDLPNDISWMEDKIKNMVLQGSDLHTTFFVKEKSYHEFLEVYKMDVEYSFSYEGSSGSCRLAYEFPDFIGKDRYDSELVIKVNSISFDDKNHSISINRVKEGLLAHLESGKLKLHSKYRTEGL